MTRNPAKDQVAFAGVGSTAYLRDAGARSAADLACEAARAAVGDAGIEPEEIDGICGTTVPTAVLQAALGLDDMSWWANSSPPFSLALIEATNAVFAGACTTALVYHATRRGPGASKSARSDPFRARGAGDAHGHNVATVAESPTGTFGYSAWAARYLHEFGATREVLGRIAVNSRTNAGANSHAVYREPLTLEQYYQGRMVREPLCLYDMDPPVDGADAFIVTTAERARDLPRPPVYLHATTYGRTGHPFADQLEAFCHTGKEIVGKQLWAKSDLSLDDVDVFFPYDGFSIMAVSWFEAVGYCPIGGCSEFLADHWDVAGDRILVDGRVPVNTHGGSLSEGASQGAGHVREAVMQLRHHAGERQVDGATCALVTPGGFMWNATGMVLRSDTP